MARKRKAAKSAKKRVKKSVKKTPKRKTKKKTGRNVASKPTASSGKSKAAKRTKSAKKTRSSSTKRNLARDRAADRAMGEIPPFAKLGSKGCAGSTLVGEYETAGESIILTFADREAAVLMEGESFDATAALYAAKIAFRIAGFGGRDVSDSLHDALDLVDRASEEEKSEMMGFVKDSIDKGFERYCYLSDERPRRAT